MKLWLRIFLVSKSKNVLLYIRKIDLTISFLHKSYTRGLMQFVSVW